MVASSSIYAMVQAPKSFSDYLSKPSKKKGHFGIRLELAGKKTPELFIKMMVPKLGLSADVSKKLESRKIVAKVGDDGGTVPLNIVSLAKRLHLREETLRNAEKDGRGKLETLIKSRTDILSSPSVKKAFVEVQKRAKEILSNGGQFSVKDKKSKQQFDFFLYDRRNEQGGSELHLAPLSPLHGEELKNEKGQELSSSTGKIHKLLELSHDTMRVLKVARNSRCVNRIQREYLVAHWIHRDDPTGQFKGIQPPPHTIWENRYLARFQKGGELFTWIGKRDHPLAERFRIAQSCYEIIQTCKTHGFGYTDLKGENFLLDENGNLMLADLEGMTFIPPLKPRAAKMTRIGEILREGHLPWPDFIPMSRTSCLRENFMKMHKVSDDFFTIIESNGIEKILKEISAAQELARLEKKPGKRRKKLTELLTKYDKALTEFETLVTEKPNKAESILGEYTKMVHKVMDFACALTMVDILNPRLLAPDFLYDKRTAHINPEPAYIKEEIIKRLEMDYQGAKLKEMIAYIKNTLLEGLDAKPLEAIFEGLRSDSQTSAQPDSIQKPASVLKAPSVLADRKTQQPAEVAPKPEEKKPQAAEEQQAASLTQPLTAKKLVKLSPTVNKAVKEIQAKKVLIKASKVIKSSLKQKFARFIAVAVLVFLAAAAITALLGFFVPSVGAVMLSGAATIGSAIHLSGIGVLGVGAASLGVLGGTIAAIVKK